MRSIRLALLAFLVMTRAAGFAQYDNPRPSASAATGSRPQTEAHRSQEQQHQAATIFAQNEPAAGMTKLNPQDGLNYVWIPAGTFTMGCSPGDNECFDDEKPVHHVTLSKGFWITQTLVTQAAYTRVIGLAPSHFKGEGLPVEMVSWHEAQSYCRALEMGICGTSWEHGRALRRSKHCCVVRRHEWAATRGWHRVIPTRSEEL
jgi:formylglycine-generating enzyme required for sulfatase activity